MKQQRRKGKSELVRDRHVLYEASVQAVEPDIEFVRRVYRRKRGRPCRLLGEDFCGTAALACAWVAGHPRRKAWGVDLDRRTLEWGRRRHLARLGQDAERVRLVRQDVRDPRPYPVDAVVAFNFSYSIFHTRSALREYFRQARRALLPGGIFYLDAFGGTEAMDELTEDRRITDGRTPEGVSVRPFTYIWEQASFNIVDHRIRCYIHFRLADGTRLRRAFTYDWRLWTLPELQEILLEAGFASAEVYLENWDEEAEDTDGVFRRRTRFDNQEGWVAYVVGLT